MGNLVDYTWNSALMWGVQVTESNQTPCALNIDGLVLPTMHDRPHPALRFRFNKQRLLQTQRTTISSKMEQICRNLEGFSTNWSHEMN